MFKIFSNVMVGLSIRPPLKSFEEAKWALVPISVTHLNFFNFFCRPYVFNVSERATKNPFLWYLFFKSQ